MFTLAQGLLSMAHDFFQLPTLTAAPLKALAKLQYVDVYLCFHGLIRLDQNHYCSVLAICELIKIKCLWN